MTSSWHESSDNSEADEQQEHSESLAQSPHATGLFHPSMAGTNVQYIPMPPPVGSAMTMVPPAYPYPDPYYRSIFAPYDSQHFPPAQSYSSTQPVVHLQLMGTQQAGVPLPSDAVEEPVFVNAKQYHGILRRRQSRAKDELEKKAAKSKKPYLHESRHLHAMRRARGCGGRFVNSKKSEDKKKQSAPGDKVVLPNINLNPEKSDVAVSDRTS